MTDFSTLPLAAVAPFPAPDGSKVRPLLGLKGGSFAHFELLPGETSKAVAHHTVEEIWFIVGGRGQMWRKQDGHEKTVELETGVCLTIPLGTHFQFRCLGDEPLAMVAVTMPPWPTDREEAYPVEGTWPASVGS
jgi:mannose-6-phosphate isomerase-like protein (cupin superfamily)